MKEHGGSERMGNRNDKATHLAGPIVMLVFTLLTTSWGCISFIISVVLSFTIVIPLLAVLIYIVSFLTMTVVNIVGLVYSIKRRKKNQAYSSALALSIVSSAFMLANVVCVIGFILLNYALNPVVNAS